MTRREGSSAKHVARNSLIMKLRTRRAIVLPSPRALSSPITKDVPVSVDNCAFNCNTNLLSSENIGFQDSNPTMVSSSNGERTNVPITSLNTSRDAAHGLLGCPQPAGDFTSQRYAIVLSTTGGNALMLAKALNESSVPVDIWWHGRKAPVLDADDIHVDTVASILDRGI